MIVLQILPWDASPLNHHLGEYGLELFSTPRTRRSQAWMSQKVSKRLVISKWVCNLLINGIYWGEKTH